MPTIYEAWKVGNPAPYKLNIGQDLPIIDSQEIVGIEVEVENSRVEGPGLNKVWIVKPDGSLRNGGIEFVTAPIEASTAPTALNLLKSWLNKDCSFSMRTSVHVHLNVGDFTTDQVKLLTAFYVIYEKWLFNFVGKGRWKSVFCVPLNDSEDWFSLNEKKFGAASSWNKYTAFNLKRLGDIGTIEFRHMHGTNDIQKLSTWIGIICKLKKFVGTRTVKQCEEILHSDMSNKDLVNLGAQIFEEYFEELKITDISEFQTYLFNAKVGYNHKVMKLQVSKDSPLYKDITDKGGC